MSFEEKVEKVKEFHKQGLRTISASSMKCVRNRRLVQQWFVRLILKNGEKHVFEMKNEADAKKLAKMDFSPKVKDKPAPTPPPEDAPEDESGDFPPVPGLDDEDLEEDD